MRLSQNFVKNWKFSWKLGWEGLLVAVWGDFGWLNTRGGLTVVGGRAGWSWGGIKTVGWPNSSRTWNLVGKVCWWYLLGSWMGVSQNFVKNWKFSWPRSLAKFQILTTFSSLSIMIVSEFHVSKWYSKVFLCWFEGFLEVWGWVKILSKI